MGFHVSPPRSDQDCQRSHSIAANASPFLHCNFLCSLSAVRNPMGLTLSISATGFSVLSPDFKYEYSACSDAGPKPKELCQHMMNYGLL